MRFPHLYFQTKMSRIQNFGPISSHKTRFYSKYRSPLVEIKIIIDMKPILILFFLLSIYQNIFSQSFEKEHAWLTTQVKEIQSLDSEDYSDLQFLKEELKGKRIVQLGESSHGIGDYYAIKSRLVKFLHKEMGFTVLALEGGFGDINLANVDRDKLSARFLIQNTVFGNFINEEMLSAFEHVKESPSVGKPLQLAGFDCQSSSSYFQQFMVPFLKDFDPVLSEEFDQGFSSSFKLYSHMNDSLALMSRIEQNSKLFEKIKALLNTHQGKIRKKHPEHPKLIEIIAKTIDTFEKYWNFSFTDFQLFKSRAIRDELMAENFIWLAEELYPKEKIIIWAHNGHISKGSASWTDQNGDPIKRQGELLAKHFKNQNYVIGLFAIQGESYQHWTKKYINFDHRETDYLAEYKFKDQPGRINYLPLADIQRKPASEWLFKPITVYQVETMGEFQVDPFTEIYDAVIVLDKVKRPTLLSN